MSLVVFLKILHMFWVISFFPFHTFIISFHIHFFFFYPRKVDMFVRLIEFLRDEQNRLGPQILVTHQYSVIK